MSLPHLFEVGIVCHIITCTTNAVASSSAHLTCPGKALFPATPLAIKWAGHPRFPFLWALTYLGIYTLNYGYINIKWHFFSRIISRCQRCYLISAWFMESSPSSSKTYTVTQVIFMANSHSLSRKTTREFDRKLTTIQPCNTLEGHIFI